MAKQTIQIADKPTLDGIKVLLENSGYGLEALKELISTSGGGETTYPNVSSGTLLNTAPVSVTGKGKVYLSKQFTASNTTIVTIDGVDVSNIEKFIPDNYGSTMFTFEKSLTMSSSVATKPIDYIIQLAD